MKRYLSQFLLLVIAWALLPTFVFAQESIKSFHANIAIQKNSQLLITETIEYDFESSQRHGIYRDIPYKYKARGGNYNLRLSDVSVTDEAGSSRPFTTNTSGQNFQIKIGDANTYVSGIQVYTINYSVDRAINFLDEHDELYWNVTGDKWAVPILSSSATISLPENIRADALKITCFSGIFGSEKECMNYKIEGDNIVFSQDTLHPNEGLTIVVGIPKNILNEPTFIESLMEVLKDNWILFLPFATLFTMIGLWYTHGKDPQGRVTIVPQYEEPDSLTPAEVGTIIDENAQNKDITATIIDLAVRGYIRINKLEKKIFRSQDYQLDKVKEGNDLQNPFEKTLMSSLFKNTITKDDLRTILSTALNNTTAVKDDINEITSRDAPTSIKISDLKDTFYKDMKIIKESLYTSVVQKGYFPKSPQKVRGFYIGIGFIAFFSSFFVGGLFGALGVMSILISGIIIIAFSWFMPVKTKKGVLTKEHILGLKQYLSVAEKDRLKFHHGPENFQQYSHGRAERSPKQFEKFLPYAMALGVEEEWAEQFKDMYKTQPDWYNDPTGNAFNSVLLANSLGSFSSSAASNMTSKPSSASSGGSGFSGGGSGGGFGGGGGGSW